MFNVKNVEEIFEIIEKNFSNYKLEKEIIRIEDCNNRILTIPIFSNEDIPHFNKSAVDGYAVNSFDTFGANDSSPIPLLKKGSIQIGEKTNLKIQKGEAIYIPTGGEIPDGADAVIMLEWTTDYKDEYIYINKPVSKGANIIYKGDDFKKQELIFSENTLLTNKDIIILASLGIKEIEVKKKLKIGIIPTGDELIEISEKIDQNKVRDINTYSILATFNSNTFKIIRYGIVKDDFDKIKNILEKALSDCDIVLLSGGSSVGTKDLSLNILNSFEESEIFCHGIAIKPGKPTIISKIKNKPVVILPGHPLSCFMILNFFVIELVQRMLNISITKNKIQAIMTTNYPSNIGRDELIPIKILYKNKNYFATPLLNKSGLISSILKADGFIHKKREKEGLTENEIVEVTLF